MVYRCIRWIIVCLVWASIASNILATKFDYCSKELISLGRHVWRCTSRGTTMTTVGSTCDLLAQPEVNISIDLPMTAHASSSGTLIASVVDQCLPQMR